MIQTDEDKPDTTAPRLNSLPDQDTILMFAGHLRVKREARKAAAKVEGVVKKQMINAGITMKVFSMVEEWLDEGPDAIFSFMKKFQHIAQAFQLPIGAQMELFENPAAKSGAPSLVAMQDAARADGRMRGLMGFNPDSEKYPENSDLGQRHIEGWHEGQEVLGKKFIEFNEAAAKAEAEKKAADEAKAKKKAEREAAKTP